MVEELKKLQNNIKKKKDELDLLITKNANENDIFLKSVEIDNAIAIYLKATKQYEDENKRFLGKYKNLLEKNYKDEIISMIRKDILEKTHRLSEEELNHFCDNVYVLCSLKAYNIEEQEILKQVMYRNNLFLYEMQQKNVDICNNTTFTLDLRFYTKLKNKYVKIIKERI